MRKEWGMSEKTKRVEAEEMFWMFNFQKNQNGKTEHIYKHKVA